MTARSGIVVAGWGMVVAVVASFLYTLDVNEAARPHLVTNVVLAAVALGLGLGWAWWSGKKVAMTAMPQMVALYNGMGGGAAAAIAAIELYGYKTHGVVVLTLAVLGGLIGSVSLSGSLIAWAKLDGRINKTLRMPGLQVINGLFLLVTAGLGAWIIVNGGKVGHLEITVFFVLALVYGVMMTMPIGGADMPVVISLYNAFTGLAVGFEGYVINNPALMIAGMVVGSAGTLLTLLMAKAMNRSVSNVLFSNFGATGDEQQGEIAGSMKPVDAGDALVVANTGDSDAYLCREGRPVRLTNPHHASDESERVRITNAGGHASISSIEGQGTTVRLLIPTATAGLPRREIKLDAAPDYAPAEDRMLLILEEDISIRTLMVHTLEGAGFTVQCASNREEALQMSETLEPDLFICARLAAGLNDTHLITQLRNKFPGLRILFTGSSIESDPEEWRDEGNVRFLAKPYRSSDLVHSTRVLLGHSVSR